MAQSKYTVIHLNLKPNFHKIIFSIIKTTQISFLFSRIGLIYADFGYRTNDEFQLGLKFGLIAVLKKNSNTKYFKMKN